MDENRIIVGDRVTVHFHSSHSLFEAEVLYLPQATGDSWILREEHGDIVYVQIFEQMQRWERK